MSASQPLFHGQPSLTTCSATSLNQNVARVSAWGCFVVATGLDSYGLAKTPKAIGQMVDGFYDVVSGQSDLVCLAQSFRPLTVVRHDLERV